MNPGYNHPSYNYQQHTPGPPQPPWQSDPNKRTGWGDPRLPNIQQPSNASPVSQYAPDPFSHQPTQPTNLPPPPPRPPPSPFSTAQWGVKYSQAQNQNQNQSFQSQSHSLYEEQRPALPPRPNSSLAQHISAQLQPQSNTWQQPTYTPQQPSTDPWSLPPSQAQSERPPIPPPRPPAYAAQPQIPDNQLPHPQYSHQPPTHHYDPPSAQNNWYTSSTNQPQPQTYGNLVYEPSTSSWHQIPQPSDGTVSPLEDESRRFSVASRSQTVSPIPNQVHYTSEPAQAKPSHSGAQISATALGYGQPSDWQHYQPSEPYENDDETLDHTPTVAQKPSESLVSSPDQFHKDPVKDNDERIRPPDSRTGSYTSHAAAEHSRNQSQSPSITSTQNEHLQFQRTGSSSRASSINGLQRTGTIDSVIQAWSTPLKRKPTPKHTPVAPVKVEVTTETRGTLTDRIETLNKQNQTDFPPIIKTETKIETRVETKEVEVDPYKDIQDHYGATLKRFAGMLRQEAEAADDTEKFRIFQGFVIHELRLRSVLYGVETQNSSSTATSSQPEPVLQASEQLVIDKKSTIPKTSTIPRTVSPQLGINPLVNKSSSTPPTPVALPISSQPANQPKTPPSLPPLAVQNLSTPGAKDDSFVVVNMEDGDGDYSPGGRPRAVNRSKPLNIESHIDNQTDNHGTIESRNRNARTTSPAANAPMTFEDYVMPDQTSPSNDAPMLVESENPLQRHPSSPLLSATISGPLNFQPPRPVYTPFKYSENSTSSPPVIKVERTAEDYTALRQAQAAESGRMLVNDLPPISPTTKTDRGHTKSPSFGRREHEEAFIGLIRQQSNAMRKKTQIATDKPPQLRVGTPSARNVQSPAPVLPPLTKTVRNLRSIVPQTVPVESVSDPKLDSIKRGVAAIRDDFSFIHATVLAWDMTNRKIRHRLETERGIRQSDNEARVDQLFHDNEIGYADIANIESDFKLNEAGIKYQEDKLELESFTKDVFETVVNRIEGEVTELAKLQVLARDLLDLNSESRGRRIATLAESKPGNPDKAQMADVMDIMLQLFNKIEVRFLKLAEAHVERERRRKKLELSVLYTNNDAAAIKSLERDFSRAQTTQVREEARKKNERANKIMDSFDRAVVRGLAENQNWIEDVLPKLQLLRDLILGSNENGPQEQSDRDELLYGPDGVKDLMIRIQAAIDAVNADSQRMLRSSYAADQILNEADYDTYLAEEKLADSDAGKFQKLKQDKKNEDERIREEFEGRLSGVCKDPEEVVGLIRDITARVGNDKEHKVRIERALDEAKKRNMGGPKAGENQT